MASAVSRIAASHPFGGNVSVEPGKVAANRCSGILRLLKGLLSHLDPRMSWGDLVTRLVRDAVARHDPRGAGSGHRRRS